MTVRFADTVYYLALLHRGDAWYARATELSRTLAGQMVTTAWVLTEVADGLSDRAHRQRFLRFLDCVRANPACLIVPASEELFERGLELYRQRPDKDWSLTDCISFVVMRDHGLTDALTADRHFEQAGFSILLR